MSRFKRAARDSGRGATREKVLDLVTRQPGIPAEKVLDVLDIGWGTLSHHLERLKMQALVRVNVEGRRKLLYPAGSLDEKEASRRARLFYPKAREIAQAVLREPGISIAAVSDRCGLSPRVVYYHLKELLALGLIEKAGRYPATLYPAACLAEDLARIVEVEALRTIQRDNHEHSG